MENLPYHKKYYNDNKTIILEKQKAYKKQKYIQKKKQNFINKFNTFSNEDKEDILNSIKDLN